MADKLQKDELISVRWADIETNASWNTPEEINEAKAPEAVTSGFFHHIKDGNFIIKPTVAESKEADYTIIPIGCIRHIKLLQVNEGYIVEVKKIRGKYNIYVRKSNV